MAERRSNLTFGMILILIGAWFLAVNLFPELEDFALRYLDWPFWVVGAGILFLVAAVSSGVPGLAVPGAVISGIGGILAYQNATNDYESWAYAWTLIVGFVGIGIFLQNLFEGQTGRGIRQARGPIGTSIVLFLIFSSFFRYIFGQDPLFGEYWPALLIVLGIYMLIRPMFRRKQIV